jgi:hypothetical protein
MNGLDIIRADNPYVIPLRRYVGLAEWPQVLLNDPLDGVDRRGLSERERKLLLKLSRLRFEPTEQSIAIVSTIQDMLWGRVTFGNPLLPENRFRTIQTLAQRGRSLTTAAWLPDFADALMVMGCTATGKTTTIKRYVALIDQYYVHERRDDAEWTCHVQITYLIVPMPVHRGGLLFAILAAIDAAIGTNYRAQYADHRRWPIEKLAIEVAIILVQHGVGVLIIEEIQARNFSMSPNREEMLLFILRLLNFGVPIVLVGNPLGFVGLEAFSQDLNRLTENEPIHLMPADIISTEWADGLGPGMWSHNVMPKSTRWSAAISKELHACSAAFPGYVRKAVDSAQLSALGVGAPAVDLSHLQAYRQNSRTFQMNRSLIEGFAQKDPLKLMKYLDVPWQQYGLEWGKLSLEDIADASDDASEVTDPNIDDDGKVALRSVHRQIRAAAAAQVTRAANKARRRAAAGATASAGSAVTSAALATGLDALKRNLAGRSPKATDGQGKA